MIGSAPLRTLDDLSRDVWRAHAAELVDDNTAQRLAESIQARREATRGGLRPVAAPVARLWSYFPSKRPQRSPDRIEAIGRRRRLAASSPLPPTLAAKFTLGELAVLRVVADEVRDQGRCVRTVPEIAARAGVCASTARNAIRQAARLGLATIEERRRHCRPNLANVVRIISREWLAWIHRSGGFKKPKATDIIISSNEKRAGWNPPQRSSVGWKEARFGRERE